MPAKNGDVWSAAIGLLVRDMLRTVKGHAVFTKNVLKQAHGIYFFTIL